jgi:hypothetical protein
MTYVEEPATLNLSASEAIRIDGIRACYFPVISVFEPVNGGIMAQTPQDFCWGNPHEI